MGCAQSTPVEEGSLQLVTPDGGGRHSSDAAGGGSSRENTSQHTSSATAGGTTAASAAKKAPARGGRGGETVVVAALNSLKSRGTVIFGDSAPVAKEYVRRDIQKTPEIRAMLLAAVRGNVLFGALGTNEMQDLVDALEPQHVPSNTVVIRQGDAGDNFYVVESGSFDIIVDGRKVADWGEGTTNRTFGELALLYNSPRAATVRATTDAKLWAIDRLTFRSVIAAAARAQHTKLKQALRRGILENLSDAQLDRIADAATVVRYARGDHIIRKGEEGEVFFIIESGSVICKNMSGDQANNVLHEGEYFGERALLRREPRAADVFAETDTSLIALHREDFENLLGELREVLEYNQGMRLLLCVPVLAGLAESDREALFASLRVATYEEGQVVMPDGFVPTSFYIVKEGSVAVVRKRAGSASPRTVVSDTIQMLLPGHFFPRTELATQAPLPVSYVAHRGGGSVQLFVTDRATYMRILAPLVGPTAHRGVPAVSQGGGRLGAPSETVAAVAPQPRLRVSPEPPQLLAPVAASQHLPAPTADAHQRSGGAKRSASPSKNTAATPQQPQKGATPTGRTATATAAAGGAPSRSRDAAAPPSGAVAASTAAATHAQPSAAGVKSSSSSRAAQTAVSGTAHRAAAGGASAAGTPLNAAPAPSSHSREATGVSSTSSSSAVSGTSSHTWESPASAPTHHHGRDTPPSHSASSSSQQQQRPATGGAATSGSKAPLLRHADTPPGPSLQVFMPPRRPSGGGGDWGSVASSTQAVSGGGGGRYAAAAQPRSPRRRLGIPFKELELRATLGTGTFGRVRLVYHRRSGRVFALKMLQKSQIVALKQQANIMSERELLWRCDHPFVIKLYDTYRDRDRLYMLLELVQGGELFARLQNAPTPGRIAPNDARFYGACVLDAFDYLHSLRIVYRDLKPENLLIDADGYLKLVDFGFAKVVNEKTYTLCGTPEYLAPELVIGRGHDKGVDYWALGVLLFEQVAGYSPFADHEHHDQMTICKSILKGDFEFPSCVKDKDLRDLIMRLLQKDVARRLGCLRGGAGDVKSHRFFRHIDFDLLLRKALQPPWKPKLAGTLDTSNFEPYEEDDTVEPYSGDDAWDREF